MQALTGGHYTACFRCAEPKKRKRRANGGRGGRSLQEPGLGQAQSGFLAKTCKDPPLSSFKRRYKTKLVANLSQPTEANKHDLLKFLSFRCGGAPVFPPVMTTCFQAADSCGCMLICVEGVVVRRLDFHIRPSCPSAMQAPDRILADHRWQNASLGIKNWSDATLNCPFLHRDLQGPKP